MRSHVVRLVNSDLLYAQRELLSVSDDKLVASTDVCIRLAEPPHLLRTRPDDMDQVVAYDLRVCPVSTTVAIFHVPSVIFRLMYHQNLSGYRGQGQLWSPKERSPYKHFLTAYALVVEMNVPQISQVMSFITAREGVKSCPIRVIVWYTRIVFLVDPLVIAMDVYPHRFSAQVIT